MSKTTKIILVAIAVYLLTKRNPTAGQNLSNAASDYWTAGAVLSIF